MPTTPRTAPAPAADPVRPSAEPLPDFRGVDVAAVAVGTAHPVLGDVAALLLRNWPCTKEAVAYFEDESFFANEAVAGYDEAVDPPDQ